MEIRPHRRLVISYEPPRFSDLVAISESVSIMYEHIGVAKFSYEMCAFTDVAVLRRMCDSLGLKLMIESGENAQSAASALSAGADFVIVRASEAHQYVGEPRVLVRSDSPAEVPSARLVGGVACDVHLVRGVRAGFPDSVIVCLTGDPVKAVKDGANYVVVGDEVLGAASPPDAARDLSEEFREYT